MPKGRAPRNRTLTLTAGDKIRLSPRLKRIRTDVGAAEVLNQTLHQDLMEAVRHLPPAFVDLLILDPPYNLAKDFNGRRFRRRSFEDYTSWMESWFDGLLPLLKPTASVYVCGDWLSSASIFQVLTERLIVRNRISWEREKGRGAKGNWKNCSEDIWFATVSGDYHFDPGAVMLKRKVIAPYRVGGSPKDWNEEKTGNFRLTHPSNLWSDITVPFWSMPENTDHPTQKPEKLIAKLVLASTGPGAVVLDPFLGSGTTSVVCRKLGRRYVGIEIDRNYCLWTEKRLEAAEGDKSIQGYSEGTFWERNTLAAQRLSAARGNGGPKPRAAKPAATGALCRGPSPSLIGPS